MTPDATATYPIDHPLDLKRTVGSWRMGTFDRTIEVDARRLALAVHTPDGPGTLEIVVRDGAGDASAWGDGAGWLVERGADMLGKHDDPTAFAPEHRLLRDLHHRFQGMRLARSHRVVRTLFPVVLGQLVTWRGAARAFSNVVDALGEEAPGPLGLRLIPSPRTLATTSVARYTACGVLGKQARTLREIGRVAPRLEEANDMPFEDAYRRLTAVPGIGPWTAGSVMLRVLGHADAVPVGDYHIPNMVSWVLAREPRADDARMLELLEPYAGQRGRVIRLMGAAGLHAPRYGPPNAARPLSTW